MACSTCSSELHPHAGRGLPLDAANMFGHEFTGQVLAAGLDSEVRGTPLYSFQSHAPAVLPSSEVPMWVPMFCMAIAEQALSAQLWPLYSGPKAKF